VKQEHALRLKDAPNLSKLFVWIVKMLDHHIAVTKVNASFLRQLGDVAGAAFGDIGMRFEDEDIVDARNIALQVLPTGSLHSLASWEDGVSTPYLHPST